MPFGGGGGGGGPGVPGGGGGGRRGRRDRLLLSGGSRIAGEPRPGLFGEVLDGVDRLFQALRLAVAGLLGGADRRDQVGAPGGEPGERGLALLQRLKRPLLGRIELADDRVARQSVELQPGQRLVGLGLLGPQPPGGLGRRAQHRGQPVLVAAGAEDRLFDRGQSLARRNHRPTTR